VISHETFTLIMTLLVSMSALFDGVVSAKFDGFPVSRPYAP